MQARRTYPSTRTRTKPIDFSAFTGIIRDHVSALRVAQDYGLNPGRDGRCKCAFCDGERKDTLKLFDGDRGFYCYRCHAAGDVISLLQRLTGCGFTDAVRTLNDQYRIGLPLRGGNTDAMRMARAEATRRQREAEEKQERERRLLWTLWDVSDAVWCIEQVKRNEGPAEPGEPFSERYKAAVKWELPMKERRDRLFDELYGGFDG